jgi:hypothetical protein
LQNLHCTIKVNNEKANQLNIPATPAIAATNLQKRFTQFYSSISLATKREPQRKEILLI